MSTESKQAAFESVEITNERTLQSLRESVGTALVLSEGTPTMVWQNEDGEWHGTRPVHEDDGPWADLPEATRETLAVESGLDLNDPEVLPVTVLWADSAFDIFPDEESFTLAEVAEAVRRNCTPSSEAYEAGGDRLIYAVADWIENPPEWVHLGRIDREPVQR